MNISLLVDKQIEQLTSLYQVLEKELHAISSRDYELLNENVIRKEKLLNAIVELDQLLNQDSAANTINDDQELLNKVSTVNTLLNQCKKQNDVNQVAATQKQIESDKLKSILFGKANLTTYDKGGKAFSQTASISKGVKA